MILIVDTNILFSFFRDNPVRAIMLNAALIGLRLVTPDMAMGELGNIKANLMKYAKLTENEINTTLSALEGCIEVIPLQFFEDCKEKGTALSPDPKDAPFFALALKLQASIWSNEPRLKRQATIRVYSTRDVLELVRTEL